DLLSAYGPAPFVDIKTPSEPPVVSVFDGRDLTRLGSLALEGVVDGVTPVEDDSLPEPFLWWSPAVVFSPDGRTLYVIHADEDRLTRVDLAEQTMTTMEIAPRRSWFERLLTLGVETAHAKGAGGGFLRGVISPDGTRLYSVGSLTEPTLDDQGNLSFNTTNLGLRVIDASSGAELARLDTRADEISVGMDGEQIFIHGWGQGTSGGWTEVLDAASLEPVDRFNHTRLFSAQDSAGRWLYISVIGSNSSKVTIVDPASGAELATWQFGTANGVEVVEIP
ncbi:MAG: YncE family protein, partial [Anaerolineales bacterium]